MGAGFAGLRSGPRRRSPSTPRPRRTLLAEAGWRDTNGNGTLDREGREFEFELLVPAGSEIGRQVDEMLAAELSRAGVTARVRTLEWAAFVERIDAGQLRGGLARLVRGRSESRTRTRTGTLRSARRTGSNNGCYRSAEADRLMVEARRELDPARRNAIFHRLHAIFRDDAPAIFLVNSTQKFGFNRRVRGLTTSPLGLFGIWPGPLGWWSTAGAGAPAAERPAA